MADVVYDAVIGALTLRQVSQGSYDPGANVIAARASGAIDPSELYAGSATPRASFQSGDLAGLLGAVSLSAGLAISSGTITLPFQKRANQGAFAGSSAHPAIAATDGLLVVTSIESGQDRGVTASMDLHFLSTDGATDPVSGSTGNSLGAQSFTAQFDHGPGLVNATEIDELVGWRVNPGITVRAKHYQGLTFPTRLYIVSRDPSIDLTFEDLDAAMAFLGSYTALSSVNVYARRFADGAAHVAEATTSHAKFSLGDGIGVIGPVQAAGQAEGSATIRCTGLALTGSTSNAIPS